MLLSSRLQQWAIITLAFICLSLNKCVMSGNNDPVQIQLTRAVQIGEDNFQITQALTVAAISRIACGIYFYNAKKYGLLTSENGYNFNETILQCYLGTVSTPVQEQGQGGILVHGIGNNLLKKKQKFAIQS